MNIETIRARIADAIGRLEVVRCRSQNDRECLGEGIDVLREMDAELHREWVDSVRKECP